MCHCSSLRARIRALQAEKKAKEEEKKADEIEKENCEKLVQILSKIASDTGQCITELSSVVDALSRGLTDKGDTIGGKEIESRKASLNSFLSKTNSAISKVNERIAFLIKEIARLEQEIRQLEQEIAALEAAIAACDHEKNCFSIGTIIRTKNKYTNIENINIGDLVWSYNKNKKENEYSKVLDVITSTVKNQKVLYITIDNEEVKTTASHEFFVKKDDGYDLIPAGKIKIGDFIMGIDGNYYEVKSLNFKTENIALYNLEIENNESFYITKTGLLVRGY